MQRNPVTVEACTGLDYILRQTDRAEAARLRTLLIRRSKQRLHVYLLPAEKLSDAFQKHWVVEKKLCFSHLSARLVQEFLARQDDLRHSDRMESDEQICEQ